jgi:hypothetical protein
MVRELERELGAGRVIAQVARQLGVNPNSAIRACSAAAGRPGVVHPVPQLRGIASCDARTRSCGWRPLFREGHRHSTATLTRFVDTGSNPSRRRWTGVIDVSVIGQPQSIS